MTNFFGPKFWNDIHGGSTHFPIALIVASVLFDLAGHSLHSRNPERSRELHVAAFYALLLGALVAFAAVLSGLIISGWEMFGGGGALGLHHRYVWPAFGLLFGLAVWRLLIRNRATRSAMLVCVIIEMISAALMLLAGYQGGLMQGS